MYPITLNLKHVGVSYDITRDITDAHPSGHFKIYRVDSQLEELDLNQVQEQIAQEYRACLDDHRDFFIDGKAQMRALRHHTGSFSEGNAGWYDATNAILVFNLMGAFLEIMNDPQLTTLCACYVDLTRFNEGYPRDLTLPLEYDLQKD